MEKYVLFIFLISKILAVNRLQWGVNNQVELISDMSETCIDNLHTDVYLPFGMGVSDASVIIVSDNDLYPNCLITFHTVGASNGVYLMVVVEFPDHTEGSRNACQEDGSTVAIETRNINIDVCDAVNQQTFGYYATATYSMLSTSSNISVHITSKSLFETLKITVTSARKLGQYEKCNPYSEIPCLISNASVCISIELQCDENINCGSPSLNDEDVRICDETRYNRLWLVVLCGTIMLMIIVFFLIHLLRTCLPSVPDSFFIFNEDEDNKLILSTKFIAPPETLRQTIMKQPLPEAPSSSFKFKNVPLSDKSIGSMLPTPQLAAKRVSLADNVEASLSSSDTEVELDSHIYKSEIRKQIDDLIDNMPIKKDEDVPVKLGFKKPRFEETNFIDIMDRIDLPVEARKQQKIKYQTYDETTRSKFKKNTTHHSPGPSGTDSERMSPKKEKNDGPTTFSVQEKHRRKTFS